MLEPWASELTPSMPPEGLCREIAEEIGMDNLLKLAALVGGSTLYLPQRNRILRPLRDRKIREEYNGYNAVALARKYDVTQRWVRQITDRNTTDSTHIPCGGVLMLISMVKKLPGSWKP